MSTSRRRLRPEERRAELLDAAVRVVEEAGSLADLSLDAVAVAAGCSRNLAYNYFPNRDELVVALAERERDAVADRLLSLPFDAPFDDWLGAVIDAVLGLAEERGRLLLLLFEQSMFPRAARNREFLVEGVITKLRSAGLTEARARRAGPILASAIMGGAGVVITGRGKKSAVAADLRTVASSLLA